VSAVLALAPTRSVALRVDDGSYEHNVIDPSDASVSFSLLGNGNASITGDTPTSYPVVTGEPISNFDVRITETSGTLSFCWITVATWTNWTTTIEARVDKTTIGAAKTCTFTVELSLAGAATAIESGTITTTARVDA
jgi:hypothetical protein